MSARRANFLVIASIGAAILSITAAADPARAASTTALMAAGSVAEDLPETPEQRRQRLSARMAEMVRAGEGARLVQPTAPSRPRASTPRSAPARATPAAPARPAPARAAPESAAAADASADDLFRSTIVPPSYLGAPERPRGRGYTPPHLDLTTAPRIPVDDVECLTQAIYYEARNESEEGQAAVAQVVVNRSLSGAYPRDVCQVVYQRNSRTCQFTFTCDGAIGRSPVDMVKWARAERIARDVHEGRLAGLLPPESVNYHADYVSPSWSRRLERVRQIGAHIFYGAAIGGGVTPGAALRAAAAIPARGGLTFVRSAALDAAFERARAAETAEAATPAEQP